MARLLTALLLLSRSSGGAAEDRQEAAREETKRLADAADVYSPRVEEVARLCEEGRKVSDRSWSVSLPERHRRIEEESRKQAAWTSQPNQQVLRHLFPPRLPGMGFMRAGAIPPRLRGELGAYLAQHRSRSFSEAFNPFLGQQRKTKMLPLPAEWTKQGGFIDTSLAPIVRKFGGKQMDLVEVQGIRLYEEGSTLSYHVDGPERPVTVAMLLSASGPGQLWRLEMGNEKQHKPLPLPQGEMMMYEGARFAHGRSGALEGGEVAMLFAYYRPAEYDSKKLEDALERMAQRPRGRETRTRFERSEL